PSSLPDPPDPRTSAASGRRPRESPPPASRSPCSPPGAAPPADARWGSIPHLQTGSTSARTSCAQGCCRSWLVIPTGALGRNSTSFLFRPHSALGLVQLQVFIEHLLHFEAGVEQPGHHRALGDVQRAGQIFVRHSLQL